MPGFLDKIDLFNERIELKLNKQRTINTKVGGTLTILLIIALIILTYFTGNDLIYKSNPSSFLQQIVSDTYLPISIDKLSFPIAYYTANSVGGIVDSSKYLTINVGYIQAKLNNTLGGFQITNYKKLSTQGCGYSDFPVFSKEYLDSSAIKSTICPQYEKLNFNGYWTEQTLNYISLTVSMCLNSTSNNSTCKDKTEILNYLKNNQLVFNIIYIDNIVKTTNFTSPLYSNPALSHAYISTSNKKVVQIFIQENHLYTDNGIFSQRWDDLQFLKINDVTNDFVDVSADNIYVTYNIYTSNQSDLTYRNYIKISQIVASVGGLLKILIIVFSLISVPFRNIQKFNIFYKIFSDLLGIKKVNDKKGIPKEINDVKSEFMSSSTIKIYSKNNNIPQNKVNIFYPDNNIKNVVKINYDNDMKKKQKHFSRKDYIAILIHQIFCCKNKSKSNSLFIYNTFSEYIDSFTDLINITKKTMEFDYLKNIILNNNQLVIFNLIFKKMNNNLDKKSENFEHNELKKFLDKLDSNKNPENIDKKLYEILREKKIIKIE